VSLDLEPAGELGAAAVLATTRTIRRYRPDPVTDADLSAILFAATRAPSGSNRQPGRFVVLRDGSQADAAKALLGQTFRAGWSAKQEADGYRSGTGTDDSSPKARMARTMQHYVDHLESTPVVILACLRRYRPASPYEGASIYPACQNLLLAARARGLGGALTMWHHGCEDELRSLLAIPDDVALSACITLGYPAGQHGPVRRRPLGDVVFDGRWGEPAPWISEPDGVAHTAWRNPT
jgi:nitroreductase